MVNLAIKTAIVAVTFCVIVTTALFGFFTLGPKIETRFLPVQNEVHATVGAVDKNLQMVEVFITAHKSRQCKWEGASPMVLKNGRWIQGAIYFTDPRLNKNPQRELPVSRPAGNTSFGTFYIFPAGERIQMYLYHSCHPFWQSMTLMFDIPVSQ